MTWGSGRALWATAAVVFGSVANAADDPCLPLFRGDKSAMQACMDFEIQRLGNPSLAPAAVQTLNGLGEAAVPSLRIALGATDPAVRGGAADALGRVGVRLDRPRQEGIAKAVVALLSDPDSRVRQEAATALGRVKVDTAAVIQALQKAEDDLDAGVRTLARIALDSMRAPK
jgi:HEAT repeat protein